MKKRIYHLSFTIFSIVILLISLSSCIILNDYLLTVTDFYDDSCNISENSTVPLYKKTGSTSNIRYIDLKITFNLLSKLITNTEDLFTYNIANNTLSCSYTGIYDDTRYIKFDSDKNVIYLSGYSFYDYMGQTTSTSISNIEYKRESENEIEIDLSKYDIKIERENNLFLLPVELAILFAAAPNNYNITYIPEDYSKNKFSNGTLFGYFGDFSNSKYYEVIHYNYKNKTASLESRELTYKYILVLLDNYYGLKEELNLDPFEVMSSIKDDILSTDTKTFQTAEANLFTYTLADLHNSISSLSYYNSDNIMTKNDILHCDKYKSESEKLEKYNKYYSNSKNISDMFNQYQAVDFIYGDTAKIKFDTFTYQKTIRKISMDYSFGDTFAYMYYAFNTIEKYNKENNNVIKNIVIDLSINTGGHVMSLFEAISFLTNEDIVWNIDKNSTKSYHSITYKIDNDLDGDVSDLDAYDSYNYYLLTSDVTYSAANLFATIFKEMNLGKIIGLKSNGGMCIVGYSLLPDGMSINHSSITQNVYKSNGEYVGNEKGIDVDYEVSDISLLYDKEYLVNTIIKSFE